MSYLSLCTIEIIDTNKPQELWLGSDAHGIAIVIRQVELCNNNGEHIKYCKLNKSLIDVIKKARIEI